MRQVAMCVLLLAGACIANGAEASSFTFDDTESIRGWAFHDGPEYPGATGRIDWLATDGHDKLGCLRLHHDFAKGGNYVQAISPDVSRSDIGAIRMWLKKPNAHRVTFRATDSAGQTFQKGTSFAYEGWQEIEVTLGRWDLWFGGAADGEPKLPFTRFGILIENTAEPKEGDLLIDDIRLLPRNKAVPPRIATLLASDFASEPRWWPGGGAGNRFNEGDWHFQFNPGAAPSIHTSFSLPGKPMRLRLAVDSEAAGTSVAMVMAGHFARFRRTIGTLDGKAGQMIEVPLGDMATWKPLNDWGGSVHLPLRVQEISLHRTAGPQQGRIRLHRLEMDTEVPPGLNVLIYPDARIVDGQACFTVRVRKLMDVDAEGAIHCRYADLHETLGEERQPVELVTGALWKTLEFRRPLEGRPFMDATFQWIATDCASQAVSIGVAAEPTEMPSPALDPDSPIGMGLYLYRFFGVPNPGPTLEQLTTLAQRAGVKWSREEFNWGRIEPQKGQFDWAFYDLMVDTARKHGISVYGLFCYWSGWTKPYTPEGIDDYCRFVGEVVRHFKDRIRYWEVWNEPNIGFWSGPKEMYAQLLTKAYDAIKAADPQAVVLGCSTAGIDKDFIRKTMDLGGRFDELTVHPYRPRLEEESLIRELREVRDLVGGKRVWITEVGFPTQLFSGVGERQQASIIVRVYLAAIASGAVANTSWYDFRNDGVDPLYNEENFGIIRNDFRLKPAYRAFATLGRLLEGLRHRESVRIDSGIDAHRFGSDHSAVIAICSPDADRLLAVEHRGLARVLDMMGSPLDVDTTSGSLVIPLEAGFPVYLEGRPDMTFSAKASSMPLSPSRKHAHPGDTVEVHADAGVAVVDWRMPAGWPIPMRNAAGVYELKVPDIAVSGPVELIARIRGNLSPQLPLRFSVEPRLLRL